MSKQEKTKPTEKDKKKEEKEEDLVIAILFRASKTRS